jgi:anti-sigma factor RsiW
MDHHEATRRGAVEKYLLDEIAPPERDEFEEHFFDCQECAADLRTTAAFLDAATQELKRFIPEVPAPKPARKSPFAFLWRPAFAAPGLALLLLVIAYQNVVVYPRLTGEVVQVNHPEVLPSVSLIGANSRGGPVPSVTIRPGQPILLSVDIPAAAQFSSYDCTLVAPSGANVWRVPVSAEQAKDTVSIRIPAGTWAGGDYRLTVQGYSDPARAQPAELARYRFTLHVSN